MAFELGKYYKHNTGHMLYICGVCHTHMHGTGLMAESNDIDKMTTYIMVGSDEQSSVNYVEITKEEYLTTCYC